MNSTKQNPGSPAPGAPSARQNTHRNDIDGLRAVAVVAVVLFHLGLLPAGYLGVDIFFVISGYLITGIIYREMASGTFSLRRFYERRIRRILPLSVFVTGMAIAFGLFVMLPDDLENLAQSAIATGVFANNLLQAITTGDYWDVVNEYKPLMHTWSLGVEEQFYVLYPFIFILGWRLGSRFVAGAIVALTCLSLALFLSPLAEHHKFYQLPFRFFEISSGGLLAMAEFHWVVAIPGARWAGALLMATLLAGEILDPQVALLVSVLSTCGVLASRSPGGSLQSLLLENRVAVGVGLISFSLYMWHQLVFAFGRYAFFEELDGCSGGGLVLLVVGLSMVSYRLIEQPFRNSRTASFRTVLAFVGVVLAAIFVGGGWLYVRAGVIRDVPELDLRAGAAVRGMHAHYNHRIHDLNRDFESNRLRILVLGNSFARDWANVILESAWAEEVEISYLPAVSGSDSAVGRIADADIVFWSEARVEEVVSLGNERDKVFVVGTKNFGASAGIFYNRAGEHRYSQRARPGSSYVTANREGQKAFGSRYIDLMSPTMDEQGMVPVFTPSGKLISQDCRHLTRAGAMFYAEIFSEQLEEILEHARSVSAGR